MTQEEISAIERRNQTQEIVQKMLNERREMLVLLCEVSGLKPFKAETSVKESLQKFCEVLVDYIASAHFGLYERIAEGKERRKTVVNMAEETYPLISDSTQAAIEFNERYEPLDPAMIKNHLQNDISKLGELLTTRIEFEDKLITAMIGDLAFVQEVS
ncbi:MAG: Rsd/AlgQ family anti-sigma factor [Gammaproteobacteria bacterium]